MVAAWVSLLDRLFADLLHLPFPLSARLPWLGASILAFAVSFLAMLTVGRRSNQDRAGRRPRPRGGEVIPPTPATSPGRCNLGASCS
jgi:hypothetical protein